MTLPQRESTRDGDVAPVVNESATTFADRAHRPDGGERLSFEFFAGGRLSEKGVESGLLGSLEDGVAAISGERDQAHVGPESSAHRDRESASILVGKTEVEHGEIRLCVLEQLARVYSAERRQDAMAELPDNMPHRFRQISVIFDDQDQAASR